MKKSILLPVLLACLLLFSIGCATVPKASNYSKLKAGLVGEKWDGEKIPKDEVCNKFNSRPGDSPVIRVSNLSASTIKVQLSFNDESADLAFDNGGHGVIEYQLPDDVESQVVIPSFPGQISDLPEGFSIKRNFTSKAWDSGSGYLPPCSGGKSNLYSVDIRGFNANGELTGETHLILGRY